MRRRGLKYQPQPASMLQSELWPLSLFPALFPTSAPAAGRQRQSQNVATSIQLASVVFCMKAAWRTASSLFHRQPGRWRTGQRPAGRDRAHAGVPVPASCCKALVKRLARDGKGARWFTNHAAAIRPPCRTRDRDSCRRAGCQPAAARGNALAPAPLSWRACASSTGQVKQVQRAQDRDDESEVVRVERHIHRHLAVGGHAQ